MKIHCFYSDLLLSLRYFFDNILFPGNQIKSYQFNIGNRTFQLKNETANFELPAIIINYRSSTPMGYHPYVFKHTPLENNNKYPILYNKTKRLSLLLQEEQFEFNIEVSINCESQLSAIQFEHQIQHMLIINKYFHFYKFYSFLELDDEFINSDMFDVHNDEIINLFVKQDQLTNKTRYCFSVQYEPLIRLDSISSAIQSTDQRSYQTSLSLTLLTPSPAYVEIPPFERGRSFPNIKKNIDGVVVPTDDIPILTLSFTNINDDKVSTNIAILDVNLYTLTEKKFTTPFEFLYMGIKYSGNINGIITGMKKWGDFILTTDDDNINTLVILEYNYQKDTLTALFSGYFSGFMPNVKYDPTTNILEGRLRGRSDHKVFDDYISGQFKLDKYQFVYSTDVLSDYTSSLNNDVMSSPKIGINSVGLLHSYMTGINSRLLKIVSDKTKFIDMLILHNGNTYTVTPTNTSNSYCDSRGNFYFSFEFIDKSKKHIVGTVTGKIIPSTLEFIYDLSSLSPIKILAFTIDFLFNSSVGYGQRYIDSINLDFSSTGEPISSNQSTADFFKQLQSGHRSNKRKLLRNYIISLVNINDSFTIHDDYVDIIIALDSNFNIELYKPSELYWKFHINLNDRFGNICVIDSDASSEDVILMTRDSETLSNVLEFRCTLQLYREIFSKVTLDNPIFFQLYQLVV